MRISVIDTQDKILTKVLMLKGEKGDKGDAGELTNLDTELSTTSTNAVQNKVITKALNELLENSATNSFTDGIDSYFKKVVSSIEPVQAGSGTPSPTNVRTISGFTECVVTDYSNNFMPQNDVSFTGEAYTFEFTTPIPAGQYTFSVVVNSTDTDASTCLIRFLDANNSAITLAQLTRSTINNITINTNGAEIKSIILYSSDTYAHGVGDTATYTDMWLVERSTTTTISFGSAGTVYSGEVNLTTGVLTVDRGYTTLDGTENYTTGTTSTFRYFDCLSATYPVNVWETDNLSNEFAKQGTYPYVQFDSYKRVRFCFNINDTSVTTVAELQTLLQNTPAQIVYPLATPQTYQLTPTQLRSLVGTNNITSSTGDTVEVEYITNETIAWLLDLINA